MWEKVARGKGTVLHLWRNGSTGAKIAAMKAVQKIIQAQTRGSADPRVRPKQKALPSQGHMLTSCSGRYHRDKTATMSTSPCVRPITRS